MKNLAIVSLLLFFPAGISQANEHTSPINFVRTFEIPQLQETPPAKATLRVWGKALRAPFTWTVTVEGQGGIYFSAKRDDAWLNSFFADQGYLDGCSEYEECKKKWYFSELPDSIQKSIQWSSGRQSPPEDWELSTLESLAEEFLIQKKLKPAQRTKVIAEMKELLEQGFVSLAVPISPVQDDSSFMYVPSLGYFVPFWDD